MRRVRRPPMPPIAFRGAIVALLGLLGFALAAQVQFDRRSEAGLATARQEDLVRILDDLTGRNQRLQSELADLTALKERLTTGTDRRQAALEEARQRARTLGVLTGSVAATGPGISMTVEDPRATLRADVLLDALEELRDAGAEAVQVGSVRVVASTYLVDHDGGGIEVDGIVLRAPYQFLVIGDPRTLSAAIGIPGGIADSVARNLGARVVVEERSVVRVTALRAVLAPRYARPAPTKTP